MIPTGAIYKTTWEEDEGLRQYRQDNMPTGKVRRSGSTATVPIRYIYKKYGILRLCIDYKSLNPLIIPNKYTLLLINELLDKTTGRKWFVRLDLKNVYNLISITVGDEWKTAFHTKQGHLKYTVLLFSLLNAPALF